MEWLEKIEIRASDHKCSRLNLYLENILGEIRKEKGDDVQVFRHQCYPTDYCILILHRDPVGGPGESAMALNLAAGLRESGLVNHSVWVPFTQDGWRGK